MLQCLTGVLCVAVIRCDADAAFVVICAVSRYVVSSL